MTAHVEPTVLEQAGYHLGCSGRYVWRAICHVGRAIVAISTLKIWSGIITSALILAAIVSLTGCA